MTNYFEYRLHEIEVLLSMYNNEKQYLDEIEQLEDERKYILETLKYKE